MDTTRRAAEDIRYTESVVKKTQITSRKIVLIKLNAQIANRTTQHFQELAVYTKEKENSWRSNIKEI